MASSNLNTQHGERKGQIYDSSGCRRYQIDIVLFLWYQMQKVVRSGQTEQAHKNDLDDYKDDRKRDNGLIVPFSVVATHFIMGTSMMDV
jgi:hypothetical protein